MSIALLTRLVLWLFTGLSGQFEFAQLPQMLLVGALYDSLYFLYAALPLALLLALMPRWFYHSWLWKCGQTIAAAGFIFLTWFIAAAELVFWNEFQARFNFISVDYLIYRREVVGNIWQSYHLVVIVTAVMLLSLVSFVRLRRSFTPLAAGRNNQRLAVFAAYLVVVVLGYELLGQNLRESFISAPMRELASSGPYQFFAAFRNNELDYPQFYSMGDAQRLAQRLRRSLEQSTNGSRARFIDPDSQGILREIRNPARPTKANVILISVESLSARYLKYFSPATNITPHLDDLIRNSLFFDHFYATGTRTTRGLESITLSIPPTPGRSIVKRLGREGGMWSLGQVLKRRGYDVQFMYGGRGYFDNMNTFFSSNGYGVLDQSSVADDDIAFQNIWGMSDEDLYRQVLAAADRAALRQQPFFFHVMTTSNHRPYTYPEGRIDIPSGSGRRGAVKYTDYAIHRFLTHAADQGWFDNTIFVILADHCAGSAGKEDLPLERYHIPLWIFAPKLITPRLYREVASQIDVAPTVLGLLGFSYVSSAFGQDLLNGTPVARALIANYQYLGYYRPPMLSILKPQRRLERYDYSVQPPVRITPVVEDDDLAMTRAYYQQADTVYRHGLNSWARVRAVESARGIH